MLIDLLNIYRGAILKKTYMGICGIYKIENLINGKVYIGQSIDIFERIMNHKSETFNPNSRSYNSPIHRAIRKYGVENFSFEIVDFCLDKEELDEEEIYWIQKYDSYRNGYNATKGGEGVLRINREDIFELWDKGMSIAEISNETGHDKSSIISILDGYENYTNEESYKRGRIACGKLLGKKVKQYDLYGNYITTYSSIVDAAKVANTIPSNIYGTLIGKNKSAAGFQWRYEEDDPPGLYNGTRAYSKKAIVKLDENKKFIAEYESITSGARSVGLEYRKDIGYSCKDSSNMKMVAGYYWMYKEDYEADLAAH